MVEAVAENSTSHWSSHVTKHNFWLKNDQQFVQLIDQNFTNALKQAQSAIPESSFPKLIHFIWLGNKPIPSSFEQILLPQWREKHPE